MLVYFCMVCCIPQLLLKQCCISCSQFHFESEPMFKCFCGSAPFFLQQSRFSFTLQSSVFHCSDSEIAAGNISKFSSCILQFYFQQVVCVTFLHKVCLAALLYWCSSSSKYLVIFETAVIRRSMGWLPVFCARRRNEGRDAETLLVLHQRIRKANSHKRDLCVRPNEVLFILINKYFP